MARAHLGDGCTLDERFRNGRRSDCDDPRPRDV